MHHQDHEHDNTSSRLDEREALRERLLAEEEGVADDELARLARWNDLVWETWRVRSAERDGSEPIPPRQEDAALHIVERLKPGERKAIDKALYRFTRQSKRAFGKYIAVDREGHMVYIIRNDGVPFVELIRPLIRVLAQAAGRVLPCRLYLAAETAGVELTDYWPAFACEEDALSRGR